MCGSSYLTGSLVIVCPCINQTECCGRLRTLNRPKTLATALTTVDRLSGTHVSDLRRLLDRLPDDGQNPGSVRLHPNALCPPRRLFLAGTPRTRRKTKVSSILTQLHLQLFSLTDTVLLFSGPRRDATTTTGRFGHNVHVCVIR